MYKRLVYLLVFIVVLFVLSLAYAGSVQYVLPQEKTVGACQQRMSIDGRVIAHMKWELNLSREDAHKQFTPGEVPDWYVKTVRGWIDSAYRWDKDPIRWFEMEYDACEGSDS